MVDWIAVNTQAVAYLDASEDAVHVYYGINFGILNVVGMLHTALYHHMSASCLLLKSNLDISIC